jgi:hypothetical protein
MLCIARGEPSIDDRQRFVKGTRMDGWRTAEMKKRISLAV